MNDNLPDIADVVRRLRQIAAELDRSRYVVRSDLRRSSYVVRTDLRRGSGRSGIGVQRADGMVAPFSTVDGAENAAAALRDGRMDENKLIWSKP